MPSTLLLHHLAHDTNAGPGDTIPGLRDSFACQMALPPIHMPFHDHESKATVAEGSDIDATAATWIQAEICVREEQRGGGIYQRGNDQCKARMQVALREGKSRHVQKCSNLINSAKSARTAWRRTSMKAMHVPHTNEMICTSASGGFGHRNAIRQHPLRRG